MISDKLSVEGIILVLLREEEQQMLEYKRGKIMNKTATPGITGNQAIDYEEAINQMLVEMKQANEKTARDQEEIARLKAETHEILARLKAA
jgi:hypothetical protein